MEVKPPEIGFVRFCPRCGRNDRATTLSERHFAGGSLCAGTVITLEYALVNSEHQRLQSAVVSAARVWWNDGSIDALHGSMSALIAFEAEHLKDAEIV